MKKLTSRLLTLACFGACFSAWGQTTEFYSMANLNRVIPDGNGSGLSWTTNITSQVGRLSTIKVRLNISGEFNGDLYAYLRHATAERTNLCVLVNRPGRAAGQPAGYADAGMSVTFADVGGGDIHLYRTATNLPSGSPLTGTWQPDGRRANPFNVLDTSVRDTHLADFANISASGEWTLFVADLHAGGSNLLSGWELEFTGPETPPVSWPTPADIVYGTALGSSQLAASSPVVGTFNYFPAAGTMLNAGSSQQLAAVFTPANGTAYLSATNYVTITVLPKDLTITADDKNKVYGAALPELTLHYSGFIAGEGSNNLAALPTLLTAANASSPVGIYSITPSGASSPNYAIAYVSGTLTITPATTIASLTASANPATPGSALALAFCAASVPPGAGTPTGTVYFKINGTNAGQATLSGGCAQFVASSLAYGTYAVAAEYAGDGNFVGTTNALGSMLVVNTPPVASPDNITRSSTNAAKISLASLLANDSAGDSGDTLSLLAVSASSTRGAAITVTNGWAFYAPLAGDTNSDSFAYVIVDSLGATNTGVVTISVNPDVTPAMNLTLVDQGNGNLQLRFDGIPGATYTIQSCTNIAYPNWQNLTTSTADTNGVFSLQVLKEGQQKYYRSAY